MPRSIPRLRHKNSSFFRFEEASSIRMPLQKSTNVITMMMRMYSGRQHM
jgi:hypothetical protein